jgi:hypothetical protein
MRFQTERVLNKCGNRFVTVTFQKLDGTIRRYNGQVRAVTGDYVVMRGVRGEGYKSFYADRVQRVACDGVILFDRSYIVETVG